MTGERISKPAQDTRAWRAPAWAMLLLLVILLSALGLRYRGVAWSRLHPDEPTIAQWTVRMEDNSYISERFYAGGYFHMVKPVLRMRDVFSGLAKDWRVFQGYGDEDDSMPSDRLVFLRKVNVWLAVMTVGLVYLLARRVTGRCGAALAAAGFMALARLHVEHAHYAETDIALVFALTLALYAWIRLFDGGRTVWFLAAAFLSGWAIGTKFTIITLVLNVLAGALILGARAGHSGRVARMTGLTAAGLVLCIVAVLYTNQGILNWKWFWPQVTSGLESVYGERASLLGDSAADRSAVWLSNLETLMKGLTDTGWLWSFLIVIGLAFVLAPSYRRFWPVTVLFPLFYGWYFVFMSPWTRGQEFMTFFPVMALWIAIGLNELSERAARHLPAGAVRTGVAVLALAALAGSAVTAGRTASLFGWPDPRVQALRWLHMHAPLDALVGTEKYTAPVERLFSRTEYIDQIERQTPERFRDLKLDYLFRNVTSQGRGTLAPGTLQMYPRFAANLRAFESAARRLCEWGAVGNPVYMFAGHRVEWWEARPISPAAELDMPLFRAVCLHKDRFVTVPRTANSVGSAPGLWVDRHSRSFVLNGPAAHSREAYVVLQTAERPADVIVSGSGCRREVSLAPYDVAVVPIRRPAWWPRFQEYDVIQIRARPVPHIEYIPCYAQAALTISEAAMLAFQKGYADKALAFLKEKNACRAPDTAWLAFACAVETGDWSLAAELQPQARGMLERLTAAGAIKPAECLINGCSGTAIQEHCRIRMPFFKEDVIRHSASAISSIQVELKKDKDRPNGFEYVWRLPVRLAPGLYELRFNLLVPRLVKDKNPWKIQLSDSINPANQELVADALVPLTVTRKVDVREETDFSLTLQSMEWGGALELSEIELRWAGDGLLGSERNVLAAAMEKQAAYTNADAAAEASAGTIFYPWLKLTDVGPDSSSGGRRCVFKALRDGVPPLMIKAWSNGKAKRRPYFSAVLNPSSTRRGQRLEVVVPPPAGETTAGMWIRVDADVRWSPGALRIEGSDAQLLKID